MGSNVDLEIYTISKHAANSLGAREAAGRRREGEAEERRVRQEID